MISLIINVCDDCSTEQPFPHLSLSLQEPLYSLRYNNVGIRPVCTLQCPLGVKQKVNMSPKLNQKLEMIQLSEKGTSEAKTGQKLGLL